MVWNCLNKFNESHEGYFRTHRLVVLDEGVIHPGFLHIALTVGLHKVASAVPVNCGLDNTKPLNAAYVLLYLYLHQSFASSKYLFTASCHSGNSVKPISINLLLSKRLLYGRFTLLTPYSSV